MTLALRLLLAFTAVGMSLPLIAASARQDAPQFRSQVIGRAVPVRVHLDGRPVSDLESHEFVLRDSGVQQEVKAIGAGRVPIDVSLVVQQTLRTQWAGKDSFRKEIREVAGLLRDGDRLRVVAAGDDVREIGPLSALGDVGAMEPQNDTCVSLYDALASVLIRPAEPGRQHVVISMSRDEGSGSIISPEVLGQIAGRSDALLHVLLFERDHDRTIWRTWTRWPVCAFMFTDWSDDRRERLRQISGMPRPSEQLRALWDQQRRRLVAIADATGGGEIRSSFFRGSIKGPVERALNEARSGYILYYEPRGVPERGWHPLQITITRPGTFEILARAGYAY
jgi:hypothetical protein